MNRKLIRPNLADVKTKDRDSRINREQPPRDENGGATITRRAPVVTTTTTANAPVVSDSADSLTSVGAKQRRNTPPNETNAEIYYYKKQIDSHTTMIIVLTDGEEIEGTIEWYDRNALKVNRKNAPNIMLLKHNIKYMYKADDKTPNK